VKHLFSSGINIVYPDSDQILANKALKNIWFNNTYILQLRKANLIELLSVNVKNQLFQFDGKLFEQIDGVAMGSPLDLYLQTSLCAHWKNNFRKKAQSQLSTSATSLTPSLSCLTLRKPMLFDVLSSKNPALKFTMELAANSTLSFLGMNIIKNGTKLETNV